MEILSEHRSALHPYLVTVVSAEPASTGWVFESVLTSPGRVFVKRPLGQAAQAAAEKMLINEKITKNFIKLFIFYFTSSFLLSTFELTLTPTTPEQRTLLLHVIKQGQCQLPAIFYL